MSKSVILFPEIMLLRFVIWVFGDIAYAKVSCERLLAMLLLASQ